MLVTLWIQGLNQTSHITGNRMIKKITFGSITYNFCCHNSLKLKKKEPLDIENAQYTG